MTSPELPSVSFSEQYSTTELMTLEGFDVRCTACGVVGSTKDDDAARAQGAAHLMWHYVNSRG